MTIDADREQQRGQRLPLLVIALACLFVGGILGVLGGRSVLVEWNYQRASGRTQGVAIGKALRFATDTTNTAYEVSYQVEIDGRRHERTEAVAVPVWERATPGAILPIEYLRGHPQTFRVLVVTGNMARGLRFFAIGSVTILVGLAFVVFAVRPRPFFGGADGRSIDASIITPWDDPSYWPVARRSMGFWLGAILLTVGTPFAVVGLSGAHAEWRFSNDARAVEGIVLTKESRRSGRSNRRSGHAATYRFVIADRTFEGRTPLPRDVWGELVERQPATVRYLPYAPSTSRLDGARPWRGLLVMAVIGSLFTAIGARVFMRSVRSARLEWRLRRHGHATRGTVIEVRDRHLKINGVTQWRLLFEYDDAGGRRHGGAHDVAGDEALEWKVGDAGDVRYDPVSPSSAIWLGKAQPFFGERP